MWAGGNAKARLSSRKQQGDRRQVRAPLLNSRPQPPIIPASRPSLSRFPAGRLSIRFCTSLRPPSRAHAKHRPHVAERAVHLGTRREAAWAREPGRQLKRATCFVLPGPRVSCCQHETRGQFFPIHEIPRAGAGGGAGRAHVVMRKAPQSANTASSPSAACSPPICSRMRRTPTACPPSCKSEQQHVVILVRNQGLSQLGT